MLSRFEAAQIKIERSERGNKSVSRDFVTGADLEFTFFVFQPLRTFKRVGPSRRSHWSPFRVRWLSQADTDWCNGSHLAQRDVLLSQCVSGPLREHLLNHMLYTTRWNVRSHWGTWQPRQREHVRFASAEWDEATKWSRVFFFSSPFQFACFFFVFFSNDVTS